MKDKVLHPVWTPDDVREAARAAAMVNHPANPNHLQQLRDELVTLVRNGQLTTEWDALGANPCPVVDLFTREVR